MYICAGLWSKSKKVKHNSNFRWDLQRGQEAEQWLGGLLEADTVEVKRDFIAYKTKRVFVEYRSRGKDSGIFTTEADYWAFVLDHGLVIMLPTEKLRGLVDEAIEKKRIKPGGDRNSSMGAMIDLKDLVTS